MLRAQDVLVALQLVLIEAHPPPELDSPFLASLRLNPTVRALAEAVGISPAEFTRSTARLRHCNLAAPGSSSTVSITALEEFVLHGLRYVFPGEPGTIGIGLPTSWAGPNWRSLPPDRHVRGDDREKPVMPWDGPGAERGVRLDPIYPSAPQMAARCRIMHATLARIDSLRSGAARERRIAAEELSALFSALRTQET